MSHVVTAQPVYPAQQQQFQQQQVMYAMPQQQQWQQPQFQQQWQQPQFQQQWQQPQQVFLPESNWSTGVLDCFQDMSGFCDVFWCGICQMGYQYEMLTTGERRMNLPLVAGVIALDAVITGGIAAKILALHLRTEVRRRFNITPREDCNEVCTWFWCTPCSVCQTYREMSARGMWPGAICSAAPPTAPAPMGQTVSTVEEETEQFYPTKQ